MAGRTQLSWWVALRAIVWSTLFVGTVAVYIPWRYFDVSPERVRATLAGVAGLLAIAIGAALALACIGEFATRGRGTPAPMDPPRELVVHGPYRIVRNPMYVGVLLVLLGELSIAFSRDFAIYIAAWFTAMNLLVRFYEEPTLRGKFGDSYERYTREVGRWWPRRPRRGSGATLSGDRGV
jgi:protein-S-isoprenylcysteine O-methyltransferase Ste14